MRLPFLNKRITPLLPITILLCIGIILLGLFVPPSLRIPLGIMSFPILYFGLFLIYLFFFGVGTLLFKTRLNGTLLGLFVLTFLILRLNDLKHPLFFIILVALFIAVEFFFSQSGKSSQSIRKMDPTTPSHKARNDKK